MKETMRSNRTFQIAALIGIGTIALSVGVGSYLTVGASLDRHLPASIDATAAKTSTPPTTAATTTSVPATTAATTTTAVPRLSYAPTASGSSDAQIYVAPATTDRTVYETQTSGDDGSGYATGTATGDGSAPPSPSASDN